MAVFLIFAICRPFFVLDFGYAISVGVGSRCTSLSVVLVCLSTIKEVRVDFLELVENLVAVLGLAERPRHRFD